MTANPQSSDLPSTLGITNCAAHKSGMLVDTNPAALELIEALENANCAAHKSSAAHNLFRAASRQSEPSNNAALQVSPSSRVDTQVGTGLATRGLFEKTQKDHGGRSGDE